MEIVTNYDIRQGRKFVIASTFSLDLRIKVDAAHILVSRCVRVSSFEILSGLTYTRLNVFYARWQAGSFKENTNWV